MDPETPPQAHELSNPSYPGRKNTFQAKGRQSAKVASATFTVTG
jgi:hypothetical protein